MAIYFLQKSDVSDMCTYHTFALPCSKPREKSAKEINNEISAVIRQITASVTFLPLLEGACK